MAGKTLIYFREYYRSKTKLTQGRDLEKKRGVDGRLTRGMYFGHFANKGDGIPPQITYWLWALLLPLSVHMPLIGNHVQCTQQTTQANISIILPDALNTNH